jgi:hypothetical protein
MYNGMATPEVAASVRRAYAEIESRRPRTIFLSNPPAFDDGAAKSATQRKTVVGCCAATNLNGTQCSNRAAPGCGGFCKRHMPTREMLDQL